ncbi:adenylate cyclase [Rhizobium sp. BK661]|nr:adenylate cyclase [Rhizobium sp. BK661]
MTPMGRLSLTSLILVICASAASGMAYSVFVIGGPGYIGATFATSIFATLLAFEQGFILPELRRRLNGLPTYAFFAGQLTVYIILIFIANAIAGFGLWSFGILPTSLASATLLTGDVLLYALGVSALIIFILRVRDLLGAQIFVSLLLSRYRRPVREERLFLFIDLVGSTAYAERFGDLEAQEYLAAVFKTIAGPVRKYGGMIDDYIGDAVLITWHLKSGTLDAACVRCVFDVFDAIETQADAWQVKFNSVPVLRAALHGGPVVTAEIGEDHHKITYFGDTVNATARLEGLCRTLNEAVLISDELLSRLVLPPGVCAMPRGEHAVRGRGQLLSVTALQQHSRPTMRASA